MSSHPPRIAIIGGGPAGLTTGVLLHRHDISFTIFELRQKPTEKELAQPIGVLDLHEESGLAAIRKCGLFDDFLPLTGDCAQVFRVADKNGNIIFTHGSEGDEDRPEISRHDLNQLLISNIPTESIKWGYKLISATSSITKSSHADIDLDFGGTHGTQTFDLVIGADGAWSKVRKLLMDVKPQYTGRQIMTVTIQYITTKYPHLAELVGPGTFCALWNRHGVTVQRGSRDSARIYIFITTAEEHFATAWSNETATSAKSKLLEDDALFGQWGSKIKELVTVACDEESASNPGAKVDIRPVYGLPIGHTWEHKPGVTLIGDAAHLMPPSGEGVNIGMWDAVMLSDAIVKAHETSSHDGTSFKSALNPLIKDFEVEMAGRAKEAAEQSEELNGTMFAEDGAVALKDMFNSFHPPPE